MTLHVRLLGTDHPDLDVAKVTLLKTDKPMFLLEQLPSGQWRITYTENLIPDIKQLQALVLGQ